MVKLNINFETIRDSIYITLQDKRFADWVELLAEIEFMLNSTFQSTVKQSPAEIVFGKKISKEWYNVDDNTLSSGQFEINRNHNRDTLKSCMKKNIENEKEITQREFKCGDSVLVKLNGISKQDNRYEGPGEIVERRHDRSYVIKFPDGRHLVRNIEWLKAFKRRGM